MRALPNITSLRFFLAIVVVLYHIPMFCANQGIPYFDDFPLFHKGNEAVKVFFSLSGFLIIGQLYSEKQNTGTIALWSFFVRRMLRIFPLYYLILFFGLFYYQLLMPWLGYPVNNQYHLIEGLLFAIFFMPNVFFLYKPGGIIEVLWSIGIEEQFYLFIAPLMLWLRLRYIIAFLALFSIAYFVVYQLPYFSCLQLLRMAFFYFSISGLGAVLVIKYNFYKRFHPIFKYATGILFVLYFSTFLFSNALNSVAYELFSAVLFAVTVGFLAAEPIPVLENNRLKYLGKISYGLYMFHSIVIQVSGFIYIKYISKTVVPNWIVVVYFNVFVIVMTIFVSHLSYNYFEKFFLKLKTKYRKTA